MPAKSKTNSKPKPKKVANLPTSLLTRPLGLEGWTQLEPVLLAALAAESPLLLIGSHGAAKSFLLERLARALRLEYRFYNASLVNFDDLVGIPVPDEEQKSLRYIHTPTAIWDAEVVFIDELNRTRPELQNKLFPIIHERRVQGETLERLRFRWAAMNPPPNPDNDESAAAYLGAEPLDPALADRFAFLIPVPAWQDFSDDEKRAILSDQFRGEHPFPVEPSELVAEARALLETLATDPPAGLGEYLIALEPLLTEAGLRLSARRLTLLHANILAVQAARLALNAHAKRKRKPDKIDWNTSALLALKHGLPHLAETGALDTTALLAAHRQAWQLASLDANDPWRELLATGNPLERFIRAHRLGGKVGNTDLGALILDAVAAEPIEAHRTAIALAAYLAVHRNRAIPGTVVETLANDIQRVLKPVNEKESVFASHAATATEVGSICGKLTGRKKDRNFVRDAFTRNLLYSLLPDGFDGTTPRGTAELFGELWEKLNLHEATTVEKK
jgi:MoxR-like ATPase